MDDFEDQIAACESIEDLIMLASKLAEVFKGDGDLLTYCHHLCEAQAKIIIDRRTTEEAIKSGKLTPPPMLRPDGELAEA